MKNLGMVAWILMVVGAINWGLVGAFGMNLVSAIFGGMGMVENVVYVLVGLSGVYALAQHFELV